MKTTYEQNCIDGGLSQRLLVFMASSDGGQNEIVPSEH